MHFMFSFIKIQLRRNVLLVGGTFVGVGSKHIAGVWGVTPKKNVFPNLIWWHLAWFGEEVQLMSN